jgi:hypothetical protein
MTYCPTRRRKQDALKKCSAWYLSLWNRWRKLVKQGSREENCPEIHVNDYERRNSTVISLPKALSMQMHMDLNYYKIVMLMLEIGCSFEECRVERSIGLKIILNLYQNFRALIFTLKKRSRPRSGRHLTLAWFSNLSFFKMKIWTDWVFQVLCCASNFLSSCSWTCAKDISRSIRWHYPRLPGLTMKTLDSRQWIVADLAISALKLIQTLQRTIFYQLWCERTSKIIV